MPRPTKQTVDYFPHYVGESKTKYMLENRWGNDGYAFWYKLLELLCKTDGHSYNCNHPMDWEYLIAMMRMPEDTAKEILNKLADMGKIDQELWRSKIIWCDKLLNNLIPVYSKRTVQMPKKPQNKEFSPRKPSDNGITDVDNPQSKVDESKVNEIIGDIPPYVPPEGENEDEIANGESLMVKTATGESTADSPSKTRKSRTPKVELSKELQLTFDLFWNKWPNRVSRGQAEKTWLKLNPDKELFNAILQGVDNAIKLDHRFRAGGFMPHPSTWLNDKGWLDEFNGGDEGGSNRANTEPANAGGKQFKPSRS